MKIVQLYFLVWALQVSQTSLGQTSNPVISLFPEGTILHGNIAYNNDTLAKHLLDIYVPSNVKGTIPLIVFIHGGGWIGNDKYADIGYMKKTVAEILHQGYALASIDYRFATQAIFPAQIQDCNRAVSFLYDNAEKYGFDKERFALMGFSAGGHLASLQGLSDNNQIDDFCHPDEPPFRADKNPANLLICRVFHFSCIHMISFKTTFLVCNSVCKAVRILL